jgi:hypothetical protein
LPQIDVLGLHSEGPLYDDEIVEDFGRLLDSYIPMKATLLHRALTTSFMDKLRV